jgi:hypothetical protein
MILDTRIKQIVSTRFNYQTLNSEIQLFNYDTRGINSLKFTPEEIEDTATRKTLISQIRTPFITFALGLHLIPCILRFRQRSCLLN